MQSGTCLLLIPSSLTCGTLFRGCTASDEQMKVIVPTSIREFGRTRITYIGEVVLGKVLGEPPRHSVAGGGHAHCGT